MWHPTEYTTLSLFTCSDPLLPLNSFSLVPGDNPAIFSLSSRDIIAIEVTRSIQLLVNMYVLCTLYSKWIVADWKDDEFDTIFTLHKVVTIIFVTYRMMRVKPKLKITFRHILGWIWNQSCEKLDQAWRWVRYGTFLVLSSLFLNRVNEFLINNKEIILVILSAICFVVVVLT